MPPAPTRSPTIEVLATRRRRPPDALDLRGYTALDVAIASAATDGRARLRAFGAKATIAGGTHGRQTGKFDPAHARAKSIVDGRKLALAIARNDAATVQRLLDAGRRNPRLPQGDTLLQAAADARAPIASRCCWRMVPIPPPPIIRATASVARGFRAMTPWSSTPC